MALPRRSAYTTAMTADEDEPTDVPPPASGWAARAILAAILILAARLSAEVENPAAAVPAAGSFFGWLTRRRPAPAAPAKRDGPTGTTPRVEIADLVRVLDIPAIVLDAERRILAFNRHAGDLFPAMAPGHPLAAVSRNPELLQSIERVAAAGRPDAAEITERMLQGRRFIVTASPLPAGAMLLLQFRDTSEQERLAQLRADFIANASHELRTPLASIKGFIETLQGPARGDEDARSRFLSIMDAQAARMNRILDDLLSLSRIEMRAHLRPEGEVDLEDVVLRVIRGLEPLARQADVRLTFTPAERPLRVRGDKDELEQVMQNLVHNAIKYGRKGGVVEVTVAARPATKVSREAVTISVRDDGVGIAPEHLPRLTERFYRVDTARSREQGGTGLGLAIVKHILARHQGELEITSEIGRGSCFTVVLARLPG